MNYKELKNELKAFRLQGLTDIKLTASQEILQTEYNRIVEQLEINQMMAELDGFTTEEVLEIVENIETNLKSYDNIETEIKENTEDKNFDIAVNTYIEIVDKVLSTKFNCDYKVNRSMINEDITVKDFLSQIAEKMNIYKTELLFAVEINIENELNYPEYKLGKLRHDSLNSFLRHFADFLKETEQQPEETTPPVLEVATEENDPCLDIAIEYFTKAVNHVFKRFKSNNIIAKGFLTHYIVNDVSVNDFIKFLNLNSGIEINEFMEYLEYHLEDQYEYLIKYSYLDYGKYPVKMILQDFAYSIEIYQLVA